MRLNQVSMIEKIIKDQMFEQCVKKADFNYRKIAELIYQALNPKKEKEKEGEV